MLKETQSHPSHISLIQIFADRKMCYYLSVLLLASCNHNNIHNQRATTKELHHKKAVTLLFVVRRSRLGPIQNQAVLKQPKWRASAKVAESPVMIIKSVFSL